MKRRHKNKYIMEPETAKIIINIATLYFIMKDLKESAVYYQHALEVLYRGHQKDDESYAEVGKVHMSLANINRYLGNSIEARTQFRLALEQLDMCQDHDLVVDEKGVKISQLMLEARYALKAMQGSGAFSYGKK